MAKTITLFNHKGGVSKTTTAFGLSWKLAELGHTVMVVDTDPQCNLTGLVLGSKAQSELESFYKDQPERNIHAGLSPAFESKPVPVEPVECVEVDGREGMFLLPGSIRLSEYETTLGIAQELTGAVRALQNLPGSLSHLFQLSGDQIGADYIILDVSPGLGAINQNLLATSDYFIVPMAPDFFSVMAVDSLARVIPRWADWGQQAASMDVLKDASYPFRATRTKFLGSIVQKFRPRAGSASHGFQKWIDELSEVSKNRLLPTLRSNDLVLGEDLYRAAEVPVDTGIIVEIADFNTLIALSHECQKPVFALSEADMKKKGIVLSNMIESRDRFDAQFKRLAEQVVIMTS